MRTPPFISSRLADAAAIRVWRHRDYRLLMSGLAAYFVTGWMQRVGVGWLAWELSHSYAWVGAIAAADLLPLVILGPFAGAIADRGNALRQLRWSQIAMIAQAAALAVTAATGMMSIEWLLALSIMSGLIQPVYHATRQKIIPAIVPRVDFASAITFDSTFFHGSRFIGPMIAAPMIVVWGVTATFAVHVAGCLNFYGLVARMAPLPATTSAKATEGMLASVRGGLAYARHHDGIRPLFVMLAVASLVARPLQDHLPGFAGGILQAGPTGLAWLSSGMGLGSLGAGLFLTIRGHMRGMATGSIAATCGLAVATFGFVTTTNLGLAIVSAAVWGFALTLMGVGIQAQTQLAVADAMRGRVMMLYAIIYRGLPAVGALGIGFIAEVIGLRSTFALAAALTLLAWLAIASRHQTIEVSMSVRDEAQLAPGKRSNSGSS